ncbi:MAG: 16S rRNA (uracil(1498)-N(3))-methyltransferase [Anaeromicrobium sp.]|jgi:16S rRNA (uracil1498-N3)-methyltransferase|nr:16S rRNA (uracil(1498)-N(3))-methyltransferase [Anaeromicrobium sp.]MCT4594602.1 16S rRNA (uracil(1498)-N(3))-methyltransferase [Anaeromicrobium sp.]
MHRFFVEKHNIDREKKSVLINEGEDVKHISKVLRLDIGEKIEICDGHNKEYICEIEYMSKKDIRVSIIGEKESNREADVIIDLYQGLPKATKMDTIIQKCTELGINKIIPILTKRCVAQIKDKKSEEKKLERWEKIALSAAKQCKRGKIPTIGKLHRLNEAIDKLKEYDIAVVAYEDEETHGLKNLLRNSKYEKIAIIIGPEGGFEKEEIDIIKNNHGKSITLGPRILRTETAGFTALSIIMYEIGDLGGR